MKLKTFFNPIEVLKEAGYKKHFNGMIRKTSKKSRFHAIIKKGIIDLHFDKSQGKYHSAAYKETLLKGEIKKIKKADYNFALDK